MGIFPDSLDAIYAAIGVPASFVAIPGQSLVVVDKTAGVDVNFGAANTMPTMVPAACVRAKELASHSVQIAALVDTHVTFNGNTWKIYNTKPRPNPEGEANGEYFLFLRRV